MKRRDLILWVLLAVVGAGLLGLGYGLRGYLDLAPAPTLSLTPDPACDLHLGSCALQLPDGEVRFGIAPREIPLVAPLRLEVELTGVEAGAVQVDIRGLGMDMGINLTRLRATGNGRFSGETLLPVCIRSRMDWEARVLVETEQGWVAAPFRFATSR
jgi:hypothetical protein